MKLKFSTILVPLTLGIAIGNWAAEAVTSVGPMRYIYILLAVIAAVADVLWVTDK
jgi:hypothetical protein